MLEVEGRCWEAKDMLETEGMLAAKQLDKGKRLCVLLLLCHFNQTPFDEAQSSFRWFKK